MVSTRSSADSFLPSPPKSRPSGAKKWSHTPTPLILLWLFISIPLVTWDTLYVLLRPQTSPEGYLHSPAWKGYGLYGAVDYVYGWPAFQLNGGFKAAQLSLNVLETLGYLVYLGVIWREGGRDRKKPGLQGRLGARVDGGWAAVAVLAGFTFSVMTLTTTVLYGVNEFYSGFKNIGHNDTSSIIFLWMIPNVLWIVFPTYMVYVFGSNILDGLVMASDWTVELGRKGIAHKEE